MGIGPDIVIYSSAPSCPVQVYPFFFFFFLPGDSPNPPVEAAITKTLPASPKATQYFDLLTLAETSQDT